MLNLNGCGYWERGVASHPLDQPLCTESGLLIDFSITVYICQKYNIIPQDISSGISLWKYNSPTALQYNHCHITSTYWLEVRKQLSLQGKMRSNEKGVSVCGDPYHTQSCIMYFLLLTALLLATQSNQLGDRRVEVTDADSRSELTLKGLFNYFWKNDPYHKNIEFLFVCGELGDLGASKPSQCSCYVPTSCVNCYRWWTAIALEAVAAYGIHMNTTNHSSIPSVVYKHSPYNAEWDAEARCIYIDDFLWYGLAYLKVYDWLSVSWVWCESMGHDCVV